MGSSQLTRRFALAAGAVAIVGMGSLTACSSTTKDKPAETKEPTQSSVSQAPVAPTEKKSVGSFTPSVTARPAPTALPGNVVTGN